jgi:hypothetical protein
MADPVNTISSFTARNKYMSANMQEILKKSLIAEKICAVDRSDTYTIQNPYGSTPTVSITALTGTYAVTAYTTTNDALTVNMEVKYGEHIYNFEQVISNFDLFAERADRLAYAVGQKIDYAIVNLLCEDGTGTYSTPSGGFTTASNWNKILSNLLTKWAGYSNIYNGMFLVVEAGDLSGIVEAQMTNGFSFADTALNNGFVKNQAGIDIYVVVDSTFANDTIGDSTVTNSGHRVAGIKNSATYAQPRGIQYEEKSVSGRTGKEIVVWGLFGFKLWTQMASMIIDITVTA